MNKFLSGFPPRCTNLDVVPFKFPVERPIQFPVYFYFGSFGKRYGEAIPKTLNYIYPKWKDLTESPPMKRYPNRGFPTGRKNGITVIKCTHETVLPFMRRHENTLVVTTPSKSYHYYFQYEEALESVYNALPGITVLNDGMCSFYGVHYFAHNKVSDRGRLKPDDELRFNREQVDAIIMNDMPIAKMPQELLELLLDLQKKRQANPIPIDQDRFNLLDTLSEEWFTDPEMISKLILAMRNEIGYKNPRNNRAKPLEEIVLKKTVVAVLHKHNYDRFYDRLVDELFERKLTAIQKRVSLYQIGKAFRYDLELYDQWMDEYFRIKPRAPKKPRTPKKPVMEATLVYEEGNIMKLSDINRIFERRFTKKTLKEIDARFAVVNLNICKFCYGRHIRGCCVRYTRRDMTSASFVKNVAYGEE